MTYVAIHVFHATRARCRLGRRKEKKTLTLPNFCHRPSPKLLFVLPPPPVLPPAVLPPPPVLPPAVLPPLLWLFLLPPPPLPSVLFYGFSFFLLLLCRRSSSTAFPSSSSSSAAGSSSSSSAAFTSSSSSSSAFGSHIFLLPPPLPPPLKSSSTIAATSSFFLLLCLRRPSPSSSSSAPHPLRRILCDNFVYLLLTAKLQGRPAFEADDQSALIYLLLSQRNRWVDKVYIENSYYLHGFWTGLVEKFEEMMEKYHPGLGDESWCRPILSS